MDIAQSKFYNEGVQSRKRFRFGHLIFVLGTAIGSGAPERALVWRFRKQASVTAFPCTFCGRMNAGGLCRAVKDVMGAWQYDQTDIAAWLSQNGLTES